MSYCCLYSIEERLDQRLVHRNTAGFMQNRSFCKDCVLNTNSSSIYSTILSHNDIF